METIKEEKKADLEQLLNRLIKKGWEPFGSYKDIITRYKYNNRFFEFNHEGDNMVSIRELVSKESGLWQFVCENGLLNVNKKYEWEYWTQSYKRDGEEYTHEFSRLCEKYRLIESSLKDESELESFILDNIKVGNED